MANREENEKKFGHWVDNEEGTRTYRYEVRGRRGWSARYIKIVDGREKTLSFKQEVYDAKGALKEVHEKFPDDKGHKKLKT